MMQKTVAKGILWLAARVDRLVLALERVEYRISVKRRAKLARREVEEFVQSVEDLVEVPNQLSQTVAEHKYRAVVRDYFVLKRAIAIFEAYEKALPYQLMNELRNALDHMMRSMVTHAKTEKDSETKHLQRMSTHIQRAVLDSMKLVCAFFDEDIEAYNKRFSDKAKSVVQNGQFAPKMAELRWAAKRSYLEAREQEYEVGSKDGDQDVVGAFLQAVVAHRDAHRYMMDNLHNLTWAKYKMAAQFGIGGSVAFLALVLAATFRIEVVSWIANVIRNILQLPPI